MIWASLYIMCYTAQVTFGAWYSTCDASVCMSMNKNADIIEYQLVQTIAITYIANEAMTGYQNITILWSLFVGLSSTDII